MNGPTPRRLGRVAALLAAALASAHFASFDIVQKGLVTDVRQYVYMAWQVTEGVPPHLSSFDPKTQFASFAGALFFALGELIGVEPLYAMRAGYLGLAALGGWLAFFVHRRLGGGSVLAGLVGTLAFCSFGLIGALPAIGPVPKLGMAVATSATALLIHSRRWWAAGAVATVAFLDWQIGALTCVAALASALLFGRPRSGAALKVLGGGALVGIPYAAYFAYHGALRAAWDQTVSAALFRGATGMERYSFTGQLGHIHDVAREDCPEHIGLFYAGIAAIPVAFVLCWRWRRDERMRLLLPLAVVQLGVVGFSLVDFQGHGDLNPLLHALAFFLALSAGAAVALAARRLRAPAGLRAGLALLVVAVGTAIARPGPLRPRIEVGTPLHPPDITLDDQREVAAEVARLIEGRELAVLEYSELLYFLRRTNPLPTTYWDHATLGYFQAFPGEGRKQIMARFLAESVPTALLFYRTERSGNLAPSWRAVRVGSKSGRYSVLLHLDG